MKTEEKTYIDFCRKYSEASNVPADLIRNTEEVYSYAAEKIGLSSSKVYQYVTDITSPYIRHISPDILYGIIPVDNSGYRITVGPIFIEDLTEDLINRYMLESDIPLPNRSATIEFLYSIPEGGASFLARQVSFICSMIIGKDIPYEEILNSFLHVDNDIEKKRLENNIENQENERLHLSYSDELALFETIRQGNIDRLESFLKEKPLNLIAGRFAHSPLRQAKNAFINLITNTVMIGAIPGGVSVEISYNMMDIYIYANVKTCRQLKK